MPAQTSYQHEHKLSVALSSLHVWWSILPPFGHEIHNDASRKVTSHTWQNLPSFGGGAEKKHIWLKWTDWNFQRASFWGMKFTWTTAKLSSLNAPQNVYFARIWRPRDLKPLVENQAPWPLRSDWSHIKVQCSAQRKLSTKLVQARIICTRHQRPFWFHKGARTGTTPSVLAGQIARKAHSSRTREFRASSRPVTCSQTVTLNVKPGPNLRYTCFAVSRTQTGKWDFSFGHFFPLDHKHLWSQAGNRCESPTL